jgi:hypothetical protein
MESGKEQAQNTLSVPLYVDLLKQGKADPVEQIIINVFDGKGFADIVIPRKTEPGLYTIRAYTNWMRNFGEDGFFHKDIWIGDMKEVDKNTSTKSSPSRIDFFPEGGDLVAGLPSKVAFKALDGDGKGEDVIGYILNSRKDTLLRFESEYLGMGTFDLSPEPGERYDAWVKMAGIEWLLVPLPSVNEKGLVISVEEDANEEDILKINIRHNYSDDLSLHLIGLSQGEIVFSSYGETYNKSAEFKLSKDEFNPGIMQLTVMDDQFNPRAERLVYMHQFAKGAAIFKAEKERYTPKEMVRMEIQVQDEFGIPIEGDFSISVTDAFQVAQMPNASNIYTHFLFENELQGEIEMPAYYFDPENESAVMHLDNLLLTQGWRRFSWDRLNKLNEFPEYKIEEGLSVEGVVKTLDSKPIKEPQQITMILNSFYEMPLVLEGETDAMGNFSFGGLNFTDSVWVFAQAYLEKEKKSGEVKQLKFNEIELLQPKKPLASNRQIKGLKKPDDWVGPEDYLVEVSQAKEMMEQFLLGREIELAEVTITARRKDKLPDNRAIFYNDLPESSLEVIPEHYVYMNVFQLIRGRFAGVNVVGDVFGGTGNPPAVLVRGGTISGPAGRGGGQAMGAQIWIDGNPASAELAMTIPVINIERVDLLRSLARTAILGGPTVNILTRTGNPNPEFVKDPRFGMGNAVMFTKGYAPYREFYVPPSENDTGAPIFRDYRSTIYWNPDIQTGMDGKVFIEFPLTEGKPEINFTLEGLSHKKQPIHSTFSMKVQ